MHPWLVQMLKTCLALLIFIQIVSSSPQSPFERPRDAAELRGLLQLHDGNQKFRDSLMQGKAMVQQDPGFMIIGCTDSQISPSAIFNAPAGSIITHTNIGNLYSSKDSSVTAAVSYAVEASQVQHIIVLGHYGCKGAQAAIATPKKLNKSFRSWIKPIAELYTTSRRLEIAQLRDSRKPHRGQPDGIKEAPPSNDPGFRALVEENVKRSVRELRNNSLLAKAYTRPSTNNFDVFVHGFVLDEMTGEVIDLAVSFGPPGRPIPYPPFRALAAAQKFRHDRYY